MWKKVWTLEVPHVVKIFMWRALNNALPTRVNLFKRKVVDSPTCSICGCEDETTTLHAIWSCPSARDVWGGGTSPFQKCVCEGPQVMQVFYYCMQRYDREELNLMVVVSRCIWLRHNGFGAFTHPNMVFSEASKFLEEFKRCNQADHVFEQPVESNPDTVHQCWQPPPPGLII